MCRLLGEGRWLAGARQRAAVTRDCRLRAVRLVRLATRFEKDGAGSADAPRPDQSRGTCHVYTRVARHSQGVWLEQGHVYTGRRTPDAAHGAQQVLQFGQNSLQDQMQHQDLKEKLDQIRKSKLTPAVPGGGPRCGSTGAFALASAPADGLAAVSRGCCTAHPCLLTRLPPACYMPACALSSSTSTPALLQLSLQVEMHEDQGLVLTGQLGRRLAGLRPPFKHNVFDAIPPLPA